MLETVYIISVGVRISKPVVPLLKIEFLWEQSSVSYIVKPPKSGGAMTPLAPLLTTSADNDSNVSHLKE